MDGAPVRGETIPIRLFLGGFDLAPTFRGKQWHILWDGSHVYWLLNDSIYGRCQQEVFDKILSKPGID